MALEKELETYKKRLPELLANEGKFVLIQGEDVVDVFGTYEDALKEGYKKFGLAPPFLIRQIEATEHVRYISRFSAPCHT